MRLLFVLMVFTTIASAQPIRYFTHFTEKDGLSDINVNCLLRDQQGYLWVGTNNGLNRYDGYTFRPYLPGTQQPEYTVSNETINDLQQDGEGYIWIATSNGLNRYDPRTETFKVWKNTGRSDGSLPNSMVWSIFIDAKSQIWLSCDNRDLCRYDPPTDKFITYPWKAFLALKRPDVASNSYKTIYYCQKKDNNGFWFLTNFGLFSFNTLTKTFADYPFPQKFKQLAKTNCPDAVYISTWDSDVLYYENCTQQWYQAKLPISPDLKGGRRQVVKVLDRGKKHWVLAKEGLFLLDTATLKIQHVQPAADNRYSAPTGKLNNYFLEKNGLLWLGGEQGLWLFDPAAQHFGYTPLKQDNFKDRYNTYCHFVDSRIDGRRYIADFYEGKILVLENGHKVKTLTKPGFCGLLYEDPDGTLWCAFGKQLYQIDPKTLQLHLFPTPASGLDPAVNSFFYSMTTDANGNFWLGNSHEGVFVWQQQKKEWWKPGPNEGFLSSGVREVFADVDRRTVWIATEDYGLFCFDEKTGKFSLFSHEEDNLRHSLGAYIVNAVCKDGQGYIWAATDPGGISRFDYDAPAGESFITLNSKDGLPSNQVYSIVADAAGNIWAGTAKGLARVDASSLQVRSYGKTDGMVTDYLDLPLSLAANGELLSGTPDGYQYFHPDSFLQNKIAPEIILTSFKVFDKDYFDAFNVNFLPKVMLSWQENFFSFSFASVQFTHPHQTQYAYRLKGFDADWIFVQNRHTASYTNVPPGAYVLEIKSGRDGLWNEPVIQLGIYISPPFWATWWFRILAAFLLAGAIGALYLWRIGQIKKEAALKTEFNQRIARTEMAALRAQMNPHFVFNCLSSINRFILVNKPNEASAYLTKFSRLIRLVLDNSRAEIVPLNKELDALQLYIEMEQMRFNDHFEYRLKVADDVQTEHLEIPPMLIQPYVENAVWHGLMHKKTPGLLQVRVFYESGKLCIEVEDNGVGRQRALELKSRSAMINKSLGTKVTEERLEVINQLYGTNAQVITVDLKDENGNGTGTKVCICF